MQQHEYFNGDFSLSKEIKKKIMTFLLICKNNHKINIVKYMQQKIIMHYLIFMDIPIIYQMQKIEPAMFYLLKKHPDVINYEYVETKYITIEPSIRRTYDTLIHFGQNYGYRNLKILTDTSTIEEICLETGCQQIDKIYPSISSDHHNTSIDFLQSNVLPGLIYHHIRIGVICTSQTKISYDIVKIINPKNKYTLDCTELQYNGTDKISINKNKIDLHFNRQIYKIFAYLPECAKNVVLMLYLQSDLHKNNTKLFLTDDDLGKKYCKLSMFKKNNSYWKINFGKHGVNFSNFCKCYLYCEVDGEYTTEIFAISQNYLRIYNGMAAKIHR